MTGAMYLAIMLIAACFGALAFAIAAADIGHRRRSRDLARQLFDIGAITIEEHIASVPVCRLHIGRDWNYCDAWSIRFAMGKDQAAVWGSMLYRLNVSLIRFDRERFDGRHFILIEGPFAADSAAWTGHPSRRGDLIALGRPWRWSWGWSFYR